MAAMRRREEQPVVRAWQMFERLVAEYLEVHQAAPATIEKGLPRLRPGREPAHLWSPRTAAVQSVAIRPHWVAVRVAAPQLEDLSLLRHVTHLLE
jgi:hypothetical protein